MKKPPLEKKIVNQVIDQIQSRGGFAVKIHGSPLQVAGIPDVIACYRGRFLGLECKRSAAEDATALQKYWLGKITQAGGVARVIYDREQVIAILDRIDERRKT